MLGLGRNPEDRFSGIAAHIIQIYYRFHAIITDLLASGFLAHLSRRLTGELIVYPYSGVRPSSSVIRRPQLQRSSPLKPLGKSKPNFMWSILRKGERKFI